MKATIHNVQHTNPDDWGNKADFYLMLGLEEAGARVEVVSVAVSATGQISSNPDEIREDNYYDISFGSNTIHAVSGFHLKPVPAVLQVT